MAKYAKSIFNYNLADTENVLNHKYGSSLPLPDREGCSSGSFIIFTLSYCYQEIF